MNLFRMAGQLSIGDAVTKTNTRSNLRRGIQDRTGHDMIQDIRQDKISIGYLSIYTYMYAYINAHIYR